MVFATEFDPSAHAAHTHSDSKANHSPANLAVEDASRGDAIDNVVSLQMGGVAARVQPDDSGHTLVLPTQPKLPLGLKVLTLMQQGSTVLTGLLITGALVLYGSTVYADKSTDRAIAELDALQGESQQLTTANEAIKQSLAEQAIREDSGLKPYNPGDVIFLPPSPQRQSPAAQDEPAPERARPLGY